MPSIFSTCRPPQTSRFFPFSLTSPSPPDVPAPYPFTAPTVNPAMNRSTNKLYKNAIGTLAMKHAPISDPQKYTSPRTRNEGTPVEMVNLEPLWMKVSAYTNSCITSVKVKMTTVSMPATDMGRMTRVNAPRRLIPSTMAASSMSLGMALKNPIISQVQNGMVKLG